VVLLQHYLMRLPNTALMVSYKTKSLPLSNNLKEVEQMRLNLMVFLRLNILLKEPTNLIRKMNMEQLETLN
jgi:hypothetical protein